MDVFRVTSEAGAEYFEHGRTDIYQIGLKIAGTTEVTYNNKKYLFGAESILYLPKETSADIDYHRKISEQGESLCIFFDSPNKLPPEPILTKHSDAHTRGMFFELNGYYNQKNRDLFACMSVFFNILSSLNKKSEKTSKSNMSDVILYMQNHIADAYVDFNAIARENDISIDRFRHKFKEIYNISPLQYFHKMKIDYIKTLIHNKEYSISDVAEKSGFGDLNYFSRFFKNHIGVSPSEYKKMSLM